MNKLLFIFLLAVTTSCSQKQNTTNTIGIENFFWLQGDWEFKSENGIYYEKWQNTPSNFIAGKGYFISEKNDTLYSQKMKVIKEDDNIFLVLNAKNFNEDRDVKYKFINTYAGNDFFFENLFKDYPHIIKYSVLNDSTCTVLMQGNYNGKTKTESFQLSKK